MGAGQSIPSSAEARASAFVAGAPSWKAQAVCRGMPVDRDPVYVMLREVYGVPSDEDLGGYLRGYTRQMAAADLAACKAGRAMPHAREVALFHKMAPDIKDVRHKALRLLHGYSREDLADRERMRHLEQYTPTMAREDLKHFAQHGRARYGVSRYTSRVTNTRAGHVYSPEHRGYSDEVTYHREMVLPPKPARGPAESFESSGGSGKRRVPAKHLSPAAAAEALHALSPSGGAHSPGGSGAHSPGGSGAHSPGGSGAHSPRFLSPQPHVYAMRLASHSPPPTPAPSPSPAATPHHSFADEAHFARLLAKH